MGQQFVMELPRLISIITLIALQIDGSRALALKKPIEVRADNEHEQEECRWFHDAKQQTNTCSAYWANGKPPVVMISLDGFRPEYLRRSRLDGKGLAAPTIGCLGRAGVRVPFMMPSFPTITFPNHYSMVTGLYPESHGIIHNEFYDPDLKAYFNIRSPDMLDPKWWPNGEPLWATAKRQGRISASYFWPGSDVRNDQHTPNYVVKYNRSVPFDQRIDKVLDWLDMTAEKRPDVITLYFEDPDATGHRTGPNSANITEKVMIVDSQIRRLIEGLARKDRLACVNLIVVSDHGMEESPPGRQLVDLATYVDDLDKTSIMFFGPVTSIRPNKNTPGETERIRQGLECKNEHMRVWTKWELPYRLHSFKSNRIPSLILDVDLGWRGIFKEESYQVAGDHGWDNLHEEMHAIFAAHGPSFKERFTGTPFENIQLYNLICALIDVQPADNNGTWGALHHLLINPPEADLMDAQRDSTRSESAHAPLEMPRGSRVLVNHDYIIGINAQGVAEWTAYTLSHLPRSSTRKESNRTWISDSRLGKEVGEPLGSSAAAGEMHYIHLFPRELASRVEEAWLDSNRLALPARMSHMVDTMTHLLQETRVRLRRPMNVISGRAHFHYPALYYIVSTCHSGNDGDVIDCPMEDRDVQAFLLPMASSYRGHCVDARKFIAYHVATLKDVERVTGMRFFPRMPVHDKLQILSWTTLRSRLVLDPTRYVAKPSNEHLYC